MSVTIDNSSNVASPTGSEKLPLGNGTGLPKHVTITQVVNLSKAATVAQTITNGVTTTAPSQDVVFDALALKADAASSQPLDAQLTQIAGLDFTGNTLKVVRVNAGETAFELGTVSGGATNLDGLSDAVTDDGVGSVYLGSAAGQFAGSAAGNTAVGVDALGTLSTGARNVAIGTGALGTTNASAASDNTVIGYQAGNALQGGLKNTLIGSAAGTVITSGTDNIMIGRNTAGAIATGKGNIFIGNSASDLNGSDTSGNIMIHHTGITGKSCPRIMCDQPNKVWEVGGTFSSASPSIGTHGFKQQLYSNQTTSPSGLATLSGGTVSISASLFDDTTDVVSLSIQSPGTGAKGHVYIDNKAAGSFDIVSTEADDDYTVFWEIKKLY